MGHAYSASWSDWALTEETWQEKLFSIQPYPSYDIKLYLTHQSAY